MIQFTNHMQLKKKEDTCADASTLHTTKKKLIRSATDRGHLGGRETGEGKREEGTGIGRDRRQIHVAERDGDLCLPLESPQVS